MGGQRSRVLAGAKSAADTSEGGWGGRGSHRSLSDRHELPCGKNNLMMKNLPTLSANPSAVILAAAVVFCQSVTNQLLVLYRMIRSSLVLC